MFATVRDSLAAIGSRTIKPQVSDCGEALEQEIRRSGDRVG